jgi:hypothetical protein
MMLLTSSPQPCNAIISNAGSVGALTKVIPIKGNLAKFTGMSRAYQFTGTGLMVGSDSAAVILISVGVKTRLEEIEKSKTMTEEEKKAAKLRVLASGIVQGGIIVLANAAGTKRNPNALGITQTPIIRAELDMATAQITNPELKAIVQSDPRVQNVFAGLQYDATALQEYFNAFKKNQKNLTSKTFSDYLHTSSIVSDMGLASKTSGPREKFDAGISVQGAFSKLQQMPSFVAYVAMLKKAGLIQNDAAVLKVLEKVKFQGRAVDEVRGQFKNSFDNALLARFTKPQNAAERALNPADFKAKKHQELLELTNMLHSSDKGAFIEKYVHRVLAPTGQTQVKVPKGIVAGFSQEQRIDLVNSGILREIKSHKGALSAEDWVKIDNYLRLVEKDGGTRIKLPDGSSTVVERMYVTMPDPRGIMANAKELKQRLERNQNMRVEIFNWQGEKKVLNFDAANFLKPETLKTWLGEAPAWAVTK